MKFEKEEEEEEEETKFNVNKFNEWIIKQEKSINEELFKKYFNFKDLVICSGIYTKQMIKRKTMN